MSGESRSERAQRGIQFVDAQAARSGQDRKKRVYAAMHVQEGDRVLDVGCGPGTDTLPLAQIVGPTGRVVGLDIQEEVNYYRLKAGSLGSD